MKNSLTAAAFVAAIVLANPATVSAALINNGGGLIYDSVLDITWAQPSLGRVNLATAQADVAALTLGGVDGWRLPYISVAAGDGVTFSPVNCSSATEAACRDSELGYMFYYNLGGNFGSPIWTSDDPDLALFPTLQSSGLAPYWSGTQSAGGAQWQLSFSSGANQDVSPTNTVYVWAVHEGSISAVPLPGAAWLFGSSLAGLMGIATRRRR